MFIPQLILTSAMMVPSHLDVVVVLDVGRAEQEEVGIIIIMGRRHSIVEEVKAGAGVAAIVVDEGTTQATSKQIMGVTVRVATCLMEKAWVVVAGEEETEEEGKDKGAEDGDEEDESV